MLALLGAAAFHIAFGKAEENLFFHSPSTETPQKRRRTQDGLTKMQNKEQGEEAHARRQSHPQHGIPLKASLQIPVSRLRSKRDSSWPQRAWPSLSRRHRAALQGRMHHESIKSIVHSQHELCKGFSTVSTPDSSFNKVLPRGMR